MTSPDTSSTTSDPKFAVCHMLKALFRRYKPIAFKENPKSIPRSNVKNLSNLDILLIGKSPSWVAYARESVENRTA